MHDNLGTPAEALSALKQARQLGIWFILGYGRYSQFDPGPFRPPEPPADASVELRAEIVRYTRTRTRIMIDAVTRLGNKRLIIAKPLRCVRQVFELRQHWACSLEKCPLNSKSRS